MVRRQKIVVMNGNVLFNSANYSMIVNLTKFLRNYNTSSLVHFAVVPAVRLYASLSAHIREVW